MSATPKELVRRRLYESFDQQYWDAVYREQCKAVGLEPWGAGSALTRHKDIPYYPDVFAGAKEVGRIRKTLQSSQVAMSRVMSNDPEPVFSGLDRIYSQVRTQFWDTRYQGADFEAGAWGQELGDAWLEGENHGLGVVEVGLMTNRGTGRQRVHLRHSPATCTFLDPYVRNLRRSQSIGFVEWMSETRARQLYPGHVTDSDVLTPRHAGMTAQQSVRLVPVLRYYDTGLEGHDPAMAVYIGGIDKGPAWFGPNPYGRFIPAAFQMGFLPPGMRRPLGRVALQDDAEKSLQTVIDALKVSTRDGRGLRAVDTNLVGEQAWQDYRDGKVDMIELENSPEKGKDVFYDALPMPIPDAWIRLYAIFDQEFTQQAQLSDLDRGSQTRTARTKFELQQIQASLAANGSGTTKRTIDFLAETVRKVMRVASVYDRDPVSLVVDGTLVDFNVEGKPSSSMSQYCSKDVPVTLNRQSLLSGDDDNKARVNMERLAQMAPYVGRGIDPNRFLLELLRVLNYDDVDTWVQRQEEMVAQQQQAAATGVAPGQPLPGQRTVISAPATTRETQT